MTKMAIIIGITIILVAGTAIYLVANSLDNAKEKNYKKTKGKPIINPRLEFNKNTGQVHYIIENSGTASAYDVEIYLPDCQEIALSRNGPYSRQISAAIAYVILQRHRLILAGQSIETPIIALPPTQESIKNITSLGLIAKVRWKDNEKEIKQHQNLPVFIRKLSTLYG